MAAYMFIVKRMLSHCSKRTYTSQLYASQADLLCVCCVITNTLVMYGRVTRDIRTFGSHAVFRAFEARISHGTVVVGRLWGCIDRLQIVLENVWVTQMHGRFAACSHAPGIQDSSLYLTHLHTVCHHVFPHRSRQSPEPPV